MQENREAIRKAVSELEAINYDTVSNLLPKLLAEGKLVLDCSVYKPQDPTAACGVGRYLVYDNPDKENPVSIWIFAFAPKQETSIHDHKFKGTVTVLQGPVFEKYYQPTRENLAKRIDKIERPTADTNYDNLSNSFFVHQVKRCKILGEGVSLTLHIYNMDARVISQDGVIVDNRNLNKIYLKDRDEDCLNKCQP